MIDHTIKIEGLDEFRRQLRAADPKFGREMGRINQAVAKPIAIKAASRAQALGGSAAKGSKTTKAARKAKAAVIAVGGPQAPWMWGAEFGSEQYAQFPAWRGNQWNPVGGGVGYFLHPTIRDERDNSDEIFLGGITELVSRAFNQ